MAKSPLLICVVGPTAIGKTTLAIEIAKYFGTEILSADSRQFFKEMSIGTAVPSKAELEEVPHHFIQNLSVHEPYSVGDFEKDALEVLKGLFEEHSVAVLVGGSGLYVDAVVNGLDSFPEVSKGIRKALITDYELDGITGLQAELEEKDPVYFAKVDIQNHHRIIRALEVIRQTGRPFSAYLDKKRNVRPFRTCYIGLTAAREIVYERINQRVDQMVAEGLVSEAKKLLPLKHLNALQTVGYRELFQYFEGAISLEEAISEIKKNTRRFAKRQGTWFRKKEEIHWFDPTTPASEILLFLEQKNAIPE